MSESGADLGGGGRSSLKDSTPCRPKGSHIWYFLKIHFWPTDPKNSLKAPLGPIYTNFEGGARAEKTQFFYKNFQKVPKNALFGLFFKTSPAAPKIWPKQ